MKQCSVVLLCERAASAAVISAPFPMGGLPKLLRLHQLLRATSGRQHIKGWLKVDAATLLPSSGTAGAVGRSKVPSLAV